MVYITGTWGDQAKARGKTRNAYFRWYKRHKRDPKKVRARSLTSQAVLAGRLMKLPCEICGTSDKVEAHHLDYDQPLKVKWLCPKHHRDAHLQERRRSTSYTTAPANAGTKSQWATIPTTGLAKEAVIRKAKWGSPTALLSSFVASATRRSRFLSLTMMERIKPRSSQPDE